MTGEPATPKQALNVNHIPASINYAPWERFCAASCRYFIPRPPFLCLIKGERSADAM
jgi:hypothetical protein